MSVIESDNIYKEPVISKNSLTVLERRYLKKDKDGKLIETPKNMFLRVAENISDAEIDLGSNRDSKEKYKKVFYDLMANFEFLPNSPTLMNAGGELQQLSACFVLPVEDSMDSIFDAIKNTALIHKSGGGTGFSFSNLRPKNDIVGSTKGVSSGPISFMTIFDTATETVKQGGTRRGANMGILRIDHPDILDFIVCKKNTDKLNNFNISVAITEDFMSACKEGRKYNLINPRTKEIAGSLNAVEVFGLIVKQAWENGEPGIVFIDRINEKNPTPALGDISSTNPCGEQPLLPFEACNLGSINLNKILIKSGGKYKIDYEKLDTIVKASVRFLDNVIEKSRFPIDEITNLVKGNRKIGLGVMGFSDLLYKLEVPYNSEDAVVIAGELMKRINDVSYKASQELANERGSFPNIDKSIYKGSLMRNATRTTIAPTGTISIISSVSSGVEPVFGLVYFRNVMDNTKLVEVHPYFEEVAKERGFYSEEIMEEIAKKGSLKDIDAIPDDIKRVFVISHDISPEWHVKIQAAFQEYTDNAVSKTINFPNSASKEEVAESYFMAYDLGCKGITIYRDGSRDNQVLNLGKETKKEESQPLSDEKLKALLEKNLKPRKRPDITTGSTIKVQTGCGNLYVTINSDEGGLCEVFASMGKSGGCASSQIEAATRLISLALRSRVSPEAKTSQSPPSSEFIVT
jgi:ribonucleoside-diphosphate reductase alpha chain